ETPGAVTIRKAMHHLSLLPMLQESAAFPSMLPEATAAPGCDASRRQFINHAADGGRGVGLS
ncbi:MAG: hypothetical protein JWR44_1174, partial [Hymenobacter sp.]|nr:hypothetical protein [Hymenobacter sp.]